MAADKSLNGKDLAHFLFYTAIIGLCIVAIFYMLINSKPQVSPKVKNTGGQSMLIVPAPAPLPSLDRVTAL